MLEEVDFTGRWEIFRDQPGNGWIDWPGGPAPFDSGTVDVRLRSGRLILYRSPIGIGGRPTPGGGWLHTGERTDIVAYRRHLEPTRLGTEDDVLPF
ncbi:hypothetical protein OSH10_08660 [Kaistia defluvii]|uniref:hypothetical protein n=1 Tax=Kaistia defluvii TaxID=410841 RepID=UPI00224ED4DC|nr:hypothetical protein [Kaistia defluvii]MCX5518505.1 hypothetical protein [Kaistia defluvii]